MSVLDTKVIGILCHFWVFIWLDLTPAFFFFFGHLHPLQFEIIELWRYQSTFIYAFGKWALQWEKSLTFKMFNS